MCKKAVARKMYASLLFFLSLFVFTQLAHAGLVRTSGRGVFSSNYSETVFFVENQYLNQVGISQAAFENNPSVLNTFASRGGGAQGIDAVPSECKKGGKTVAEKEAIEDDIAQQYSDIDDQFAFGDITQAQRDALYLVQEQRESDLYGEPCVWEFVEGEALSMFAFFGMYFGSSADINYDVKWRIDGKPTLDGVINPTSKLAPNGTNTINEGWITLDTLPSFALPPGDYALRTSVNLSSNAGKFFWESSQPGDRVSLELECIENPAFQTYQQALILWEDYLFDLTDFQQDPTNFPDPGSPPPNPGSVSPDMDICGYNSIGIDYFDTPISTAPTSFFSDPELLRILPAGSNTAPPSVTAPASLGGLFLALGLIFLSRRRR